MKKSSARPSSHTQNRKPSSSGRTAPRAAGTRPAPTQQSRSENTRRVEGRQSPAQQKKPFPGQSAPRAYTPLEKVDEKIDSARKYDAPRKKNEAPRSARPPKQPKMVPAHASRTQREDGVISLLFFAVFRHFQKRFGSFFSCCICILSLYTIVALVFVSVYAGFFFGNTRDHDDVIYLYTDGTEDEKHPAKEKRLSYESVFRNGEEPYINMTELSETLGLIIVGNNRQLRFSLPDAPDSSILFTKDSRNAVVNGCNSVILTAPAKIVGRTVYVPLSFLQNYTAGFAAAYDPVENRLTVERLVDENASTETMIEHIRFRYTMGNVNSLEAISEEEIFP